VNFITLDYIDLALAGSLVLLNAGLSIVLQLGLAKRFLIAAARMTVQLMLVGLALKMLFALASPFWTALVALTMVLFAGYEIMARQDRRFKGWWGYGLGATTVFTAALLVSVFALTTQVRPDPWYDPRYAIPILGMILGNTMTGVGLGLHTITTAAHRERAAIEARLALGATRAQAFRVVSRFSLRTAMIPIINSMTATGLIALPGMMTGQILSGVDPAEAVKYQLLISFLIAGGAGIGALVAVIGGARLLSDGRHRLRLNRLHPPRD
jgi:putative ABC transport system permease protein